VLLAVSAAILAGLGVSTSQASLAAPAAILACSEVDDLAAGESAVCTLAAGETITFTIVAGNGGHGGDGGDGGNGSDGWYEEEPADPCVIDPSLCLPPPGLDPCVIDPIGCFGPLSLEPTALASGSVPGGFGGIGGVGGQGGVGGAVSGSYTNDSGSPMTLALAAGSNGEDGVAGFAGEDAIGPAAVSFDGDPGLDGDAGTNGADGGNSYIINPSVIAAAGGGTGGQGGQGGTGGQGGSASGTPGADGVDGLNGADGADGGVEPDPLPAGWTVLAGDGNPRVEFTVTSGGGSDTTAPPVTTPPVINPPVVNPPTTTPPTTTPPVTTVPALPVAPVPTDAGQLPQLDPGVTEMFVGGVPAPVTVAPVGGNSISVTGNGFGLTLAGACAGIVGCTVESTPSGGQTLVLDADGAAQVTGFGFQPGTLVHAWLFSTPTYLGALTVTADGTFAGTLDLNGIDVGEHTLQVNGIATDGAERTANLGVLVTEAPASSGTLPDTGGSTGATVPAALAIAAGVALILAGRRRKTVQ
jgi:LPXTG-motif cell wall-anchored protein